MVALQGHREVALKKAELPDWAGGLEAAPGWKERGTPLCAGEEGPHARSSRWGSHRVSLVCRAARNQQWFWGLLGELESLGCLLSACPSSTLRELGQEWARGGQEGAVWVLKAPVGAVVVRIQPVAMSQAGYVPSPGSRPQVLF